MSAEPYHLKRSEDVLARFLQIPANVEKHITNGERNAATATASTTTGRGPRLRLRRRIET
jgi:hypothetical protein